jgi:hypothetical protein
MMFQTIVVAATDHTSDNKENIDKAAHALQSYKKHVGNLTNHCLNGAAKAG